MKTKEIPVLLLTGYLGSGKTTLLNYILSGATGLRVAVVVNDIGEVNIDESLIQRGGIVGQEAGSGDLIALSNGCICCSLQLDLADQLISLADSGRFDYIVIEASGICEPAPIAQTICSIPAMMENGGVRVSAIPRLDCITAVVDALRLRDEFDCGSDLKAAEGEDADIERLIIEQIEFCNYIILNKISEISAKEAARVRAVIKAIQPRAEIIETDYCRIELEKILHTEMFRFDDVATSARWIQEIEGKHHGDHDHHHDHHDDSHCDHDHDHGECPHCHGDHHHSHESEHGIETMVYYRRRPFNLSLFDQFIARSWPREIIRAKGILYFSHNKDVCYIFEQAGRQKKLTDAGLWYAAAPQDELERLMATEPGLAADWDPDYGDRMIKLVFIGRHADFDSLIKSLDRCLQ